MKKGTAITFILGMFAGLTLCGPAAQAATNLTATLNNQPIYVDGQRVFMTAFAIGGNNYVKLRDVGEAVGFNVYWDGIAVQVESSKPYTGVAPVGQAAPPAQQVPPLPPRKRSRPPCAPYGSATPTTPFGPLPTAPPAAGRMAQSAATAPGGPSCAPMPPSAISPGGG